MIRLSSARHALSLLAVADDDDDYEIVLAGSGDHRLLSSALGKLADLLESKSP